MGIGFKKMNIKFENKMFYLMRFVVIFALHETTSSNSRELKYIQNGHNRLTLGSNLPRSKFTASRLDYGWVDIFIEFEALIEKYKPAVDLGAGFPDYMPPQHLLDALVRVAHNQTSPKSWGIHQYERIQGNERLVKILAKFYSKLMKRDLNPMKEILVTTGASHALNLVSRAFLNPGDEVIIFEPFYFGYDHYIRISGGIPVYVRLIPRDNGTAKTSNDWTFDRKTLESKFNVKTKMIWVNNPNNPTGKTFSLSELKYIGDLAIKYNVLIVSDEVAQWYYFDDQEHNRFATFSNTWNRTITICSGGKTFSNTGWRIGWAIAPEDLLWAMSTMTFSSVISVSTPMQIAFAMGLEIELERWHTKDSYFTHNRKIAIKARDRLTAILKSIGAHVVVPNAGYFVVANFTNIVHQIDLTNESDNRPGMKLHNALLKQLSIKTCPLTMFYNIKDAPMAEYVVRFTLIKTNATIDEFDRRIRRVFKTV